MELNKVVLTKEGYEVKDLSYKAMENIITGRVKCPIKGKATLHEGFVGCAWYTNGRVLPRYGGKDREDLNLNMSDYEDNSI